MFIIFIITRLILWKQGLQISLTSREHCSRRYTIKGKICGKLSFSINSTEKSTLRFSKWKILESPISHSTFTSRKQENNFMESLQSTWYNLTKKIFRWFLKIFKKIFTVQSLSIFQVSLKPISFLILLKT